MTAEGSTVAVPQQRAAAAPHLNAVSGFDGQPWPELLHGHPTILVPGTLPAALPLYDCDGWASDPSSALLHPGWSACLTGEQHLELTSPRGEQWFAGQLPLTRDWRRAAKVHQAVLVITGAFATVAGVLPATAARSLRFVVVPVIFTGETW